MECQVIHSNLQTLPMSKMHTVGDFFGYNFQISSSSESDSDFSYMGPHCPPLLPISPAKDTDSKEPAPATCPSVPPTNTSPELASKFIHIGWHIDSYSVILQLKMGHEIDLMVCSTNIYPKQPMTWQLGICKGIFLFRMDLYGIG